MNELLQSFKAFCAELKARANAVLGTLPPIEQHEATSEIAYGIRTLTSCANQLQENATNFEAKLGEFAQKAEASALEKAAATAEAVLLAKKTEDGTAPLYIKQSDHQTALTAALLAKENEVRTAVQAELNQKAQITEKRKQLVTAKTLPAVAAEAIPDSVLASADADAQIAKIGTRVVRLQKLGLTPENAAASFAQAASLGLDEAGEASFGASIQIAETAVKGSVRTGPINPAMGGGSGTGSAGATTAPGLDANLRSVI